MQKIFITGGAGFIASHLVERLVDNFKITLYDNLHRNAIQYSKLLEHPNVTFIKGDVLDKEKLLKYMVDIDICIHAAAIAGIYSVGEDAIRTMKVNLIGTYNMLEVAVNKGVRRFIDFSTSEVYGPFVFRGKETDNTTLGPVGEKRWVYAVSKLAAEHFSHAYSGVGLEVVTVRPFNVYGPRQVGEGAIQQMIKRALKNEPITVYDDGTQIRAWCFVTDFVDALEKTLFIDEARNQIFNIGNPQSTITVLALAETIIRLTDSSSKILFKPHPGPEVYMRIPDITHANKVLLFKPKINLIKGLEKTIQWQKKIMEQKQPMANII